MANNEDSGWQAPSIIQTEAGPAGVISMPSVTEAKPCYACKSFEKDLRKLDQYVLAHGMKMQPDGCYVIEEIRRGVPTRNQYRLDPKKAGWCRRLTTLAIDEATCDRWQERATRDDLRGIIR